MGRTGRPHCRLRRGCSPVIATLPLGSEVVLTCKVCGAQSSDSLAGADGWVLMKLAGHHNTLFDVCSCCKPKRMP